MSEPAPRHDPFGFGWPNLISVIRIALIPVVALLIVRDTAAARWVATAIFIVGAASDVLDGYLARRHAMTTATGAWLDPLSDKLFVAVPAVVLSVAGDFPWWATVVIIALEIAVTWLRWRLDQGGGVSMPASKVAKTKTVRRRRRPHPRRRAWPAPSARPSPRRSRPRRPPRRHPPSGRAAAA